MGSNVEISAGSIVIEFSCGKPGLLQPANSKAGLAIAITWIGIEGKYLPDHGN